MHFPLARFPAGRWVDLDTLLDSTQDIPTKEEHDERVLRERLAALAADPPIRTCRTRECGVEILRNKGNYCRRCRKARSKAGRARAHKG